MFSITVKTAEGERDYSIPTGWFELPWSKYVDFVNGDDGTIPARMSLATGIPLDVVNRLPAGTYGQLLSIVSFMFSDPSEYADYIPAEWSGVRVEKDIWGKIEHVKSHITALNGRHIYNVGAEVVATYTSKHKDDPGLDINPLPVSKVFGLVAFFLLKSQSSMSDTQN